MGQSQNCASDTQVSSCQPLCYTSKHFMYCTVPSSYYVCNSLCFAFVVRFYERNDVLRVLPFRICWTCCEFVPFIAFMSSTNISFGPGAFTFLLVACACRLASQPIIQRHFAKQHDAVYADGRCDKQRKHGPAWQSPNLNALRRAESYPTNVSRRCVAFTLSATRDLLSALWMPTG